MNREPIQQNNHPNSQHTSCVKNRNSRENPESRHGRIISPASRAVIYLDEWIANGLESREILSRTGCRPH